jgi:hypothetical protein
MHLSRWFWGGVFTFSLIGLFYAYQNFSSAFPLVELDIKMDRHSALSRASQLSETYSWGPDSYRQAVLFDTDFNVQSYVELEHARSKGFRQFLSL